VSSPLAKRSLRGQHINVQLEDAESLLFNLRGELLPLDTGPSPGALDSRLAQPESKVTYFRQSMDEVTRSVKALPVATTEWLPRPDVRGATRYWTGFLLPSILWGRSTGG
jgi:hypothetical protein